MATIASLARLRLVVPLTKRAISSSSRLYEETYEKKIRDLEEKIRFCEERRRADDERRRADDERRQADDERRQADDERRRANEETIHSLQAQLEYRPMRMRFLRTFKRDHLPGEYGITHADRECIQDGNWQANGADPVGDADLYLQAQRTDQSAFMALYGPSPLHVLSLSQSSQYPVGS